MSTNHDVATLRVEASALFEANQAARRQDFWLLTGSFVWIAVTATIALGTRRTVALVPLAPLSRSALALVFQTYSDVSVLGAARQALEARLRAERHGGLIYETAVAGIRQQGPLVTGVRLLPGVRRRHPPLRDRGRARRCHQSVSAAHSRHRPFDGLGRDLRWLRVSRHAPQRSCRCSIRPRRNGSIDSLT